MPSPRQRCRDAGDQSARLARRDAEIGPELDRLFDAITRGVDLATIVPRIKALEGERDEIAAKLAQAGRAPDVIALHPATIAQYSDDVVRLADLTAAHGDLAESLELIETARRLVAQVIVHAIPNETGFAVEVKGRLAQLTETAMFPSRSWGRGLMVAREGYRFYPHDPNLRYFLRSFA